MIRRLVDDAAEATVAGCAVASVRGARLAVERLKAADLHDARLWRVIEAAHAADAGTGDPDRLPDEVRAESVANMTGLSHQTIWALVRGRCCAVDSAGYFARRVAEAAERRREAFELVDRIEQLGLEVHDCRIARAVA